MVCQFLLYNKVNQLYTYIYPHISSFLHLPPTVPIPPLQVVTKHRAALPMLCGCFPLAIYFTFGSVYMSMPLWLHWVFNAVRGLSLVAASGGYTLLWCTGFSLWWLLLLWSMSSKHVGFSSCGTQVQQLWLAGSTAQAQQLRHVSLVALWHVGSSRTRA